jgi:hypothetical protein
VLLASGEEAGWAGGFPMTPGAEEPGWEDALKNPSELSLLAGALHCLH